jgi:hypothetical protein
VDIFWSAVVFQKVTAIADDPQIGYVVGSAHTSRNDMISARSMDICLVSVVLAQTIVQRTAATRTISFAFGKELLVVYRPLLAVLPSPYWS